MVKICTRCKSDLPNDRFTKWSYSADGLADYCRECRSIQKKQYRDTDNATRRKQYHAKGLKSLIVQRNYSFRQRLRLKMIALYGGKCNCCGEEYVEFLTLDHVFGGGCKERQKGRVDSRVAWVDAINRVGDGHYQILCMNCNWAKGKYGNCPHQQQLRIVG